MSKSSRNRQQHARERVAQMRAAEMRRKRRQRLLAGAGAAVVVAGAAIGITLAVTGGSGHHASGGGRPKLASLSTLGTLRPAPSPGPAGEEGVPVPAAPPLASTAFSAKGRVVDGIACQASEQSLFHIHAHLTVFVNGSPRQVPAEVGIPGKCLYWLHTHAADGVIHIESPVRRAFTLGQFFDEWGQPLGPGQAGPVRGHVVVIYNKKLYQGNPRDVPLSAHAQIQLEIGTPHVAPESITWPGGL